MTRAEIIAQRLTKLRAVVANDDPYLSMCAAVNVVFAAMATPGCEAQGVRLVDLPRLAERVAEMADAHEALRIEHAAWGALLDATRKDRDAARANHASASVILAGWRAKALSVETERDALRARVAELERLQVSIHKAAEAGASMVDEWADNEESAARRWQEQA